MSPRRGAADSALTLEQIAREIPGDASVVGDGSVRVTGVRHDSREVQPGDLFVARAGARADGARFVGDAKTRGAVAVIAQRGALDAETAGLPVLHVADPVDALAFASAAVYGHPGFTLETVGITGTNGKTTTTYLVRSAIDAVARRPACGLIGTVGCSFGGAVTATSNTTPESDDLARVFASMRSAGATHVAMEVSSHAIELGRVRAVRFRVAAFTNLTHDHLDFHGSMAAYAATKRALFTACAPGSAVVNVDDPFGRELVGVVHAPVVRVSASVGADADISPREVVLDARGIDAVLRAPGGDVRVTSRLVGAHNVENIVVAMGIAHALGLDLALAAEGISREAGAPGRLERCDTPADDVTVLVDYAHTPDALVRVLDAVRRVANRRVWCVFGCGGDRDPTKRAPMGDAAARRADAVVITSDNPRSEDPAAIAAPIARAVAGAGAPAVGFAELARGASGYVMELDRRRAIEGAILAASPGDVVVLAGKGHEDYQIVGATKCAFDDRVEARRALAARRAS
jgi:UDP-N-acetylmuramoyl-L-alanyl-D-glutamate--2,6-diaminopimelate ligase